ncbi:MAG: hypothetical protein F8N37_18185 [Telmatospirillum sp.]|nr:hypothetical protein [Telmatospirillum sp.]
MEEQTSIIRNLIRSLRGLLAPFGRARPAACFLLVPVLLLSGTVARAGDGDGVTLPRFPTVSGERIVFEAHGSLWSVSRAGGMASRLTAERGFEVMPRFSPDGKWIAFTGLYEGNRDVYVIPAAGGEARRLTFRSDVVPEAPLRWGPDNMVVGWTPDSRNIVFLSRRAAWNDWYGRLFTVSLDGGQPEALPLDRGGLLSFSPDGQKIAYNRIFTNFRTWKRYEGGLAQKLFVYDLKTRKLDQITDWPGMETAPMWRGNVIYFLSDHDARHRANIWAYDTGTRAFRQITTFTDYDVDFPSLGDNGIVFQQGGALWVLDLPGESLHRVDVRVPDDGVQTRPRFVDGKDFIADMDQAYQTDFDLAPNGKRVLLSARGDLFSLPVEHGDTRNLTESSNAAEDHPAFSPDGTRIAYTTDVTGEQQIAIRPADGGAETIVTRFAQGILYQPVWSPGGDRLAFADGAHRLWVVDERGGELRQIAQDPQEEIHDYSWSPDGRWIAYSTLDASHIRSLWFYSLDNGKATRVSSGRDDDSQPRFDPEGKYLYFLSARHETAFTSDREFAAIPAASSALYVAPLAATEPSPFGPRSDEAAVGAGSDGRRSGDRTGAGDGENRTGKSAAGKDEAEGWSPRAIAPMRVDLAGLIQRAVPVPIPAGATDGVTVARNRLFYVSQPPATIDEDGAGGTMTLHLFDIKDRKDSVLAEGLHGYRLSADGSRILYHKDKDWVVIDARPAPKTPAPDARKTGGLSHMRMRVDPRQEWRSMFLSAWRLQRDMFFNPDMNGVDWPAVRAAYEKLLPLAGSREDLNYLVGEMLGELGNSHLYVGGGDQNDPTPKVATAMLGADLSLNRASGHYRFARIFRGDNSRPEYRAPLAAPGLDVREGDLLLAIDGRELAATVDPDSLLVGKADRTIRLTVMTPPLGKPRQITVQPVAQELSLREMEWIETNRTTVDRLSGGRIAYVYLSDMGGLGMRQFIRQFYSQTDRQALIVDVRFNGGGFIDGMLLERLRRVLVGMQTNRSRIAQSIPQTLINGPKVALMNQYSGSDGDLFPFYFRKYGLGPLIGMRTWGGVRGIRGFWSLLDGGYVTVAEHSVYGLDSQWVLENKGVAPDIEVENLPADLLDGHDRQLETAVTHLLDQLKKAPAAGLPAPPALSPAYPPAGHE